MDYAELTCCSHFSFLEGASHPEELVDQALELGLRALALTDRDGVYGIVRAHARLRELRRSGTPEQQKKAAALRLIIGAQVTVEQFPPLVLLARHDRGYANLCTLLTRGRRRSKKGASTVSLSDLSSHAEGLTALLLDLRPNTVVTPGSAGPAVSQSPAELLQKARSIYGDHLFLGLSRHLLPAQESGLQQMVRASREHAIPLVAVGNVLYHHPSRQPLHDVLTCVRWRCTIQQAGKRLQPNAERHLHAPQQMARLFRDLPEVLRQGVEIAESCTFSLDSLSYSYPSELLPPGQDDAMRYLRQLVREGAHERYPGGPPPSVTSQLEHELQLIAKLNFPHYFLTVHDLVCFARRQGILCQGRGSAANSAVCYVLGITAVDPARSNLLFERFLSEERGEPPDIDLDCEHERREEMIQYLYQKYGRHRAAMACTVVTYRNRSALRDVGQALGFPASSVDQLARGCVHRAPGEISPDLFREAGLDPTHPAVRRYGALARQLVRCPRHLSIHVGGFVLSDTPLEQLVPIENASMAGRTVIQWDKDDLDTLGWLKVDVLALGMLTCIRKTIELVERHQGQQLSLATLPPEDPAVYDMICQADTVGVFQIESRAQMSMLPRLQPRCFYDLVVEVAIIRPGPIQGKMVHPYLRRRQGLEPVQYPHPALADILGRTYGVPLFQEQVMRLAMAVADFTAGEADELRRAMGSWRRTGRMHELGRKLLEGMRRNQLQESFAQQLLAQIAGFAEYGFPESHAASFALLVYASAYLKRHHLAAFVCGLLNSLPMGFYPPRTLVADAQRHGVAVRPVSVQHSGWDCSLEPFHDGQEHPRLALRLGFRLVKGLHQAAAEAVVQARQEGGTPFHSLAELQRRTRLSPSMLERLAEADALQELQADRRRALWTIRGLAPSPDDLWHEVEPLDGEAELPTSTPLDEVLQDYQALGFSLRAHPVSLCRDILDRQGVRRTLQLLECRQGQTVTVAGIVVARQRPATASGVVFLSLEDETGLANVIVWPRVFERFRKILLRSPLLIVSGTLQRSGLVTHLVASRLQPLQLSRSPLPTASRDFY